MSDTPGGLERAAEIFEQAVRLRGPDRARYLREACGEDDALRAEIESMLAASAEQGDFLAEPTQGQTFSVLDAGGSTSPREQPGEQIGRYKLLEKIGEGGFGSVWAAEQKEPVKRRVALKIIKLGMDTKQVIARFEAERQALAMMDHPNIAKVLDAGSTETGRPFFVMELVKGVPILDYCDTEKLDTKQRLDLFTKVCHAIQHAHQKGIIHRDIKPSNVLVTMHDGVPVPKVIDFGIAKATNQELTERTVYTQHRQMIGTPAYMSPEQAEMSGLDIDTRSDIYSLGVLLYELLTGTTPFENESLMQAGFAEMMRIIRETEPHKPSTRLSSLGATGTRTAQLRRADVHKLSTLLRGDLDWIVMKCLEKDRTRRYETANGLAADIKRHLEDEPVVAGPPSRSYRLRKFVRRNKGQVVAGCVIAAALVIGVAGTTWGMVRAVNGERLAAIQTANAIRAATAEKQAKQLAQTRLEEASMERDRALHAEKTAQRELDRATEIKRLITEMFQSVSPEEAQGQDTTLLKKILDDASQRVDRGEVTGELVAAELHAVVGDVYRRLGLYRQAESHLPRALEIRKRLLGDEHRDTLSSMNSLANMYLNQGRYAEAESLQLQAVEVTRRVLGDEHPDTLASINNLAILHRNQGRYAEAEQLYGQVLEVRRRVLGDEHPDTLASINNLAILYVSQGRYAEAEPLHLQVLEITRRVLGDEHPTTLSAMSNLGSVYQVQGRYEESESLNLRALEIAKSVLGEEHPDTLVSMMGLGSLYTSERRYAEAEPLFLRALEIQKRMLGEEHQDTLGTMNNLAVLYRKQGRYAEAEPLFLRTLEIQKRMLGEEHPDTLGTITNLGNLYESMGRYEDAATMFETSLPIKQRVLGAQHPWTGAAMSGLATAYEHLGRHDEALPLRRELLELRTARAESPDADANTLNSAAWTLLTHDIEQLRDPQRALGYAERACATEEAADGANLWQYLDTLALAQHRTDDTAAAVETQKRAISLMPSPDADPEMQDRLAEYEAALSAGDG